MTTLTDAPPVSTASAGPMSLAPPPVLGKVYDDVKLLIEGLNKHAGPEGYAVVTARSKKSKKDVDRIVYIRCDRGGKASLNSAGFGRRLHSGTRLMECPFSAVGKRNKEGGWYLEVIRNGVHNHTPTLASAHPALRRLAMTEEVRESISSLTKAGVEVGVEVSHGQEVKGSEVEGSEVDSNGCRPVCSVSYVAKEVLNQRYWKQCKPLNCLLNLVCNWVMRNGNFRFWGCTGSGSLF